jgi:hypothetical protein
MNSRRRIWLSLYLLVLLSLSAGLVGCNQPPPSKADAVTTWIKLHAIPFNTTTPDAPEQDLLPLK